MTASVERYSLSQLAALTGAELHNHDDAVQIQGIAPIEHAQQGTITFLHHVNYQKYLADTQASAVIIRPDFLERCNKPALVCADPYLAYAKLASLFSQLPTPLSGIHPTAIIADECQIDETASIGPHAVVERGVVIGKNSIIGPGCVIGDNVQIGHDCRLWANVTLYYGVIIGNHVHVHSGTVIGSDGFGYAHDGKEWVKIAQIGAVQIHDHVEIGANTTIDRGAIGDTVIGKGVKLDNQIQIGHNVSIDEGSIIAACTGVSGSVKIGKRCRISGMVGFAGHFSIADDVVVTGMSKVAQSLDKPGVYSSGTVIDSHEQWRKNAVRFRQLDAMHRRLQRLEKQLLEKQLEDMTKDE